MDIPKSAVIILLKRALIEQHALCDNTANVSYVSPTLRTACARVRAIVPTPTNMFLNRKQQQIKKKNETLVV